MVVGMCGRRTVSRMAALPRQLGVRSNQIHFSDAGIADGAHVNERIQDDEVLLSRHGQHLSFLATQDARGTRARNWHQIQRSEKVYLQLPRRYRSSERTHRFRRWAVALRKGRQTRIHRPAETNAHNGPSKDLRRMFN